MAEIITMPKLGFDMAEGTLIRWVILEEEPVAKGAILAEIETDKATVEVESTHSGVLKAHLVPEGEIVPVNTPIAVVADPGEEVDLGELIGDLKPSEEIKSDSAPVEKIDTGEAPQIIELEDSAELPGGVRASPLARRLASEAGLDLSQIKGRGPRGRIMKSDIEEALADHSAPSQPVLAETPTSTISLSPFSLSVGTPAAEDEVIPLNRLRAAIGRRMVVAKQQLPHFYVTHEYDVGELIALRKQVNSLIPPEQKLSVNDFILKATALALRQFPNLNASLDDNQIIHHGSVNIGVAVAVEGGLMTVVCHDTDRKAIRQIASEVRAMAERARDGKVRPTDIEGSTFSVSNLGMFEVEEFIAIINPPEAAILAVGSAKQVPVILDDEITTGWRMKTTISVDHRVSDGAEAARFLQALADYLENPLSLLL